MIDTTNLHLPVGGAVNHHHSPVQKIADIMWDIQHFHGSQRIDDVAKKQKDIPLLNHLTETLFNGAKGSTTRESVQNIMGRADASFQSRQVKEGVASVAKGEIAQNAVASSKDIDNKALRTDAVVTNRENRPRSESTAIFYGDNLPTNTLSDYKHVVVEAGNVSPAELLALREKDSEVFAYVSIGEANKTRKWYNDVNPTWMLGDNKTWDSKVMNLASEGWQNFLIDTVVSPLWDAGYKGLFLDTMDSFHLFAKDKQQKETQINALSGLMTKIQARYPEMHFISNRGFEVLSSMGDKLDAVVAESLFSTWDNNKKTYGKTSETEQKWLLNKLNEVKKDQSVDVIVIDYAKPNDPQNAKLIADKITQHGFSPWVSVPSLDIIPTSA